jgi:glucose-6-phosphate dehydrogenase assembly protein OpcA
MATPSAPLVSLQSPKDVSLSQIEAELSQIWQSYSVAGSDGSLAATRASTFTLVVYEPEETQYLLARLGFYTGPIDGIDGPRTEAAIQAAQTNYGFEEVTGKTSPELLTRLRQELAICRGEVIAEGAACSMVNYAMDSAGAGIADAIASQNPCRIISIFPSAGEDVGITAQVSAYCPIQKQSRSTLVCCEYIMLQGAETALARASELVSGLLIGELPRFLWWKATPKKDDALFQTLGKLCNTIVLDSSRFIADPESDLRRLAKFIEAAMPIADLNWRRLAPWQELTAEAFDPPERRAELKEVDRVTIDYEKGNSSQALMFLGWIASRLGWEPVSRVNEGGDYNLQKIHFVGSDQRAIEAELAAVPTANAGGDVIGDLVGLRLASTNPQANCGTVLCSEATGCMRMESGGGAQKYRIHQVTSLADQKAENLLSEQLRSMGQDLLYEESLAVTAKILQIQAA